MNSNNIKVYLVGGAVRDIVLGRPNKDLDFVVVGATRGYMECLGFDQVGADFPVFLHPKTKDEFALARMERKIEAGYKGFECEFNTEVTLEDDLERRDLTMNAMAIEVDPKILETGELVYKDDINEIIDPFNGVEDAKNGILRHTSEAFAEDPLRVLRTCRFAARYNFEVAEDTVDLMRDIVGNGEMNALPMERVYAEFEKAMMEDHPRKFFDYMNASDAFELYFDELCDWDNAGLDFAVNLNATLEERVSLLVAGFNPSETHAMLSRIKAPNHLIDTAVWSSNLEFMVVELVYDFDSVTADAKRVWETLNRFNAWKQFEKLQRIAHVHLYWGNPITFEAVRIIMEAVIAGSKVGFDDLDPKTRDKLVGKEIGEAISQRRLEVLEELNLFVS
jgi:tRNA nucleotidyltransferase/poly(A) polymerase